MKLGPRDVSPSAAKLGSGDPFVQQMMNLLPRLRRFARALAQANSDADDLVQLTVEKCLRERAQWADGTRLDSWMFAAMRNAWIDETRMRSRRRESFAAEGEVEQVADGSVASEELKVQAMSIRSAMDSLPSDQRLAVALVLVDGMSYHEAAELLGVPEGTLTSRLSRARATLIAKLSEGRHGYH
ncbi:MAG: RNA polymerase sigma factor [Caulobacteraceae bacterium]